MLFLLYLLLLNCFITRSSRIDRANDPSTRKKDEFLYKPAVTPGYPHDSKRIEYKDCDWINSNKNILPKSLQSKPYKITTSQIDHFHKHGHVTLPKVLTLRELNFNVPTIASKKKKKKKLRLGKALKLCAKEVLDSNAIWGEKQLNQTPSFHRIFNMWRKNKLISNLITAPRFGKIAADLLGVKKVRLYQDSLFWKAGGHNASRWHQDKVAGPFSDSTKMITMWMPLEQFTLDAMGALRFASQSNKNGRHLIFDAKYHGTIQDEFIRDTYTIHQAGYIDVNQTRQRMKRGDVSFHQGFTIHGSGPNLSNHTRIAIAVQWVGADERDGTELMSIEKWMTAIGKYKSEESEHRVYGSTVVSIFITFPSFKPVSLSIVTYLLLYLKTLQKQVFLF